MTEITVDDAISRAYIEPIVEELENICINGDEHVLDMLSNIKNAPPVNPQATKSNIKALGDEIRICQKSIIDEKVLIGFNMAVAICNKHLAESEVI